MLLIEKGTAVIVLATQERLYDKMVSNIKEIKTRGAKVLTFANEGHTEIEQVVDYARYIPKTLEILTPVISVITLQLLAYYISVQKGTDIDKPRNLAKSVTVE